tara:strand:- start:402 stop:728 length:327 start_codon:yes stop_codon:yes gene_type:complete
MKASSTMSFIDEDGHIREVQTVVNDDYTINAFYSNEFARIQRIKNKNEDLKERLKIEQEKNQRKESRGLGDWVKNTIDKLTYKQVKPCGACKKRQEMLNKIKLKDKSE